MLVRVIASGFLKKCTQGHSTVASIEIQTGATVKDLIALLELPEEETFIVAVNGQIIPFSYVLKDDDLVRIILPVSGG